MSPVDDTAERPVPPATAPTSDTAAAPSAVPGAVSASAGASSTVPASDVGPSADSPVPSAGHAMPTDTCDVPTPDTAVQPVAPCDGAAMDTTDATGMAGTARVCEAGAGGAEDAARAADNGTARMDTADGPSADGGCALDVAECDPSAPAAAGLGRAGDSGEALDVTAAPGSGLARAAGPETAVAEASESGHDANDAHDSADGVGGSVAEHGGVAEPVPAGDAGLDDISDSEPSPVS